MESIYSSNEMRKIKLYKFYKRKYGTELLIDVLSLDYIKEGIRCAPIHRETFYCIILITNGNEEVSVNGHKRLVRTGDVICSRPGEVWHWQSDPKLEGMVLIFEEAFLLSFFNDPQFLERFAYLRPDRTSPFLHPDKVLQERLHHLLMLMKTEIDDNENKDQHILRAMLYETLMLLVRAENINDYEQAMNDVSISRYVGDFVRMVDAEYSVRHDVDYYANKLCITPNYLNKIIKQTLGTTAKVHIQKKVSDEAVRLLIYTSLTVTEIAEYLHFESSSYFVRFFKKQTGQTPLQYRENRNSPQK
ncbi:AraC family transcriptional regulator [Bacteroides thetaiotaomicron]|nr:AraC family transcriptional regulator [Bacteroides thetaiotaomicron]